MAIYDPMTERERQLRERQTVPGLVLFRIIDYLIQFSLTCFIDTLFHIGTYCLR